MNIIKKILVLLIVFLTIGMSNIYAEEKVNLDDEELPAIDPFQGNSASAVTQGSGSDTNNNSSTVGGFMNGLRLVGTITGENKKLAILTAPDGMTFKYEENQEINENIILIEIFQDYLIIQDKNNSFFEVYMNNVIKPSEG
jgi:hypothetical protein